MAPPIAASSGFTSPAEMAPGTAPPTARTPKFATPANPVCPNPDVFRAVATGVKTLANAGALAATAVSGAATRPPTGAVTTIWVPSLALLARGDWPYRCSYSAFAFASAAAAGAPPTADNTVPVMSRAPRYPPASICAGMDCFTPSTN